jgi:lactoylglutathione lyase
VTAAFRTPFPVVYTRGMPRALGFYRDLLGFAEAYRFPDEGDPVFMFLELQGGSLAIADVSAPGSEPLHGRPVEPTAGHRFELCVYADDTDAAVDMLRAAGVPVLMEPADQPWGERIAYVEDPDGNPVLITADRGAS